MAVRHSLLPASFDGQVRLFPLPDLVVFPSNVLPLHIFESRYCEMLEDAIGGDQLITMATLQPGYETEYHSRPPLAPVVCVGRVTAHEKLEQGTYNLILVGLQRARIEYEIEPVRSFRRAMVTLIEDRGKVAQQSAVHGVGRQLVDRVRQTLPAAENVVKEYSKGNLTFAELIDVLAFHLPFDMDVKLQLLGEEDVSTRARLLLAALPADRDDRAEGNGYPRKFSDN